MVNRKIKEGDRLLPNKGLRKDPGNGALDKSQTYVLRRMFKIRPISKKKAQENRLAFEREYYGKLLVERSNSQGWIYTKKQDPYADAEFV